MSFKLRFIGLPLLAVPVILIGGLAVAQQQDELCFMETSSGKRIALGKFCGKSGAKAVDDFMWDETNYDPKYVTRTPDGWSVIAGGAHPFKNPDGMIIGLTVALQLQVVSL